MDFGLAEREAMGQADCRDGHIIIASVPIIARSVIREPGPSIHASRLGGFYTLLKAMFPFPY